MISYRIKLFLDSYKRTYSNSYLFKSDVKKVDKLVHNIYIKSEFMKIKILLYDVLEVFEGKVVFDFIYNYFDGYRFDEESSYILNELYVVYKEQYEKR